MGMGIFQNTPAGDNMVMSGIAAIFMGLRWVYYINGDMILINV